MGTIDQIASMSEIELIYFPIHGRCFLTRLFFELSGKDWKDTQVTYEEFMKIKPELPLGQVPILKVDGVTYAQSLPIIEYAASLTELPKLSALEQLRSRMVIDTMSEMFEKMVIDAFPKAISAPEEERLDAFYGHMKEKAQKSAETIEKVLPTTVKIAQKVINSCPKIAAFVEKADQTSFGDIFFPRTKSKF